MIHSDFSNVIGSERYFHPEMVIDTFKSNDIVSLFGPTKTDLGFNDTDIVFNQLVGYEALVPNFNFDRDNAIKDIFDQSVDYLVIDEKWVRRLKSYVLSFVTRNNDHVEFFGSPFLGTHRIIFKTSDRKEFFNEIIDVDDVTLYDNLIKAKWINKDFFVSSDPFNLSIVYLMHRVQISNLGSKSKEEALIQLVMLFHYRALTSIMNHYFGYLVKKNVAETTYNKLSLKFDIKRYGSWTALFKARAEFIIDKRLGIHYQTFTKMDDDKNIVYMINDMISRLKGVINDYTRVLYKVKDEVDLIETDSGLVVVDDKVEIKDIQKNVNKFKHYIENVVVGETGFYKEELIEYAVDGMRRTPLDKFQNVIREFPVAYNSRKGEKYRKFVDDTVTHMFEYLHSNNIRQNNLRKVFLSMRGAYTSNKSTNDLLYKIKDTGDDIIRDMTGIKSLSVVTSLRTSLMLYIVLRMLTMETFK